MDFMLGMIVGMHICIWVLIGAFLLKGVQWKRSVHKWCNEAAILELQRELTRRESLQNRFK